MNIGIDLGATKIASVLLENNGNEIYKSRIESPKNYEKTITDITEMVVDIEKKYKKKIISAIQVENMDDIKLYKKYVNK